MDPRLQTRVENVVDRIWSFKVGTANQGVRETSFARLLNEDWIDIPRGRKRQVPCVSFVAGVKNTKNPPPKSTTKSQQNALLDVPLLLAPVLRRQPHPQD
ncbi:hypothetical protein RJT34_20688 [Clitoria ternatea]|uniref:Uncharacterized protein n=1 Tax=Clitoria ternatea TaxID=43366 RepID=A0AAN9P549_CLITE